VIGIELAGGVRGVDLWRLQRVAPPACLPGSCSGRVRRLRELPKRISRIQMRRDPWAPLSWPRRAWWSHSPSVTSMSCLEARSSPPLTPFQPLLRAHSLRSVKPTVPVIDSGTRTQCFANTQVREQHDEW